MQKHVSLLRTTTATPAYITNSIISSLTQASRACPGWGGGGISRQGAMSTMYDITVWVWSEYPNVPNVLTKGNMGPERLQVLYTIMRSSTDARCITHNREMKLKTHDIESLIYANTNMHIYKKNVRISSLHIFQSHFHREVRGWSTDIIHRG